MTDPLEISPYLQRPVRDLGAYAVEMARQVNAQLAGEAADRRRIVTETERAALEAVRRGLSTAWMHALHTGGTIARRDHIEDLDSLLAERLQTEDTEMRIPHSGDGDFELAPAGLHTGYCYQVIDLGTQQDSWQGQPTHRRQIRIYWELSDAKMSDGRPFAISKRYTFSTSRKGNLRKDLEGWRGIRFTDQEMQEFQVDKLLGVPAHLNLVHSTNTSGNTYCNVAAVMRAPKDRQPYQLHNEALCLSLEPGEFDLNVFNKLTDSLKSTIMRSPEYHQLAGTAQQQQPAQAGVWPQSAPPAPGNGAQQQPANPIPDPGATPPASMQPANVPPAAPPPVSPGDYGAAWGGDDDDPILFAPCRI